MKKPIHNAATMEIKQSFGSLNTDVKRLLEAAGWQSILASSIVGGFKIQAHFCEPKTFLPPES